MKKVSKNQKVLSISVAAYNLGDMIRDNLDSFVKAPKEVLDKIEILVTNDGSTDNTFKLLEQWQKNFPEMIRVFQMHRQRDTRYVPGFRSSQNRLSLLKNVRSVIWFRSLIYNSLKIYNQLIY